MQFSPFSRYFIPFRSTYPPQLHIGITGIKLQNAFCAILHASLVKVLGRTLQWCHFPRGSVVAGYETAKVMTPKPNPFLQIKLGSGEATY
jgi:hypothetical protein